MVKRVILFIWGACLLCPSYIYSQGWAKLSCGGQFSLGIKSDGSLWAWGANGSGQCADTTQPNVVALPARVGNDHDWLYIAAGGWHSLAIKRNGTLWAWGLASDGETGLGTTSINIIPEEIGSDSDWISIAAGYGSSYAIKKSGKLYSWGYNGYGELGIGSSGNVLLKPVAVSGNTTFSCISSEGVAAAAIANNGTLWTWGFGGYGLGNGTINNVAKPQQVGKDSDWSYVSSGFGFSVALKKNGTLWSWGLNAYGQCGHLVPDTVQTPMQIGHDSNWRFIACGSSFGFAINTNGELYGWGDNDYGQLGINSLITQMQPLKIDSSTDWTFIAGATGIPINQDLYGFHSLGLKKGYNGFCGAGWNNASQLGGDDSNAAVEVFDCTLGVLTGINQIVKDKPNIYVFPNPTSGVFTVQFITQDGQPKEITLMELTGKVLYNQTVVDEGLFGYDLSSFPRGVYLLRVVSGNSAYTQKVVLN